MKEIAGFEIEDYNVFKFKDGVKKEVCPICTPNRKPENQKKKDLELYWNTGLGFCHHCHERIQLHTYKKKVDIKVYVKPKFKPSEVSSKVVKWFEGRGISKQTLVSTKVTEGLEWMPQTQKKENTIKFNYFLNGELINTKFRDGKKHFKLCKDAEKIFYNLDSIRTEEECVIVEGEIDALSFIEAGVYNVVSVPNGFNAQGSVNLDYLDGYLDFFDNKTKIYLALDNDEAGVNGKEEFIRRLGAERCYIVDFGDFKDANDYLQGNTKDDLKGLLNEAELIPMDNIVVLENLTEELDDFWLNGFERGMTMDLPDFDKHFSLALKQYTLITGTPQCFTKNQEIVTKSGSKKISKLNKGDLVLSYNEDEDKNEYREVVNTMVNKNTPDKIYKITMKDGSVIECTENHRFFNGASYVKIKELLLSLDKFKNVL